MTRGDAGLAARAGVEVDVERVLLARLGDGQRDQVAVVANVERRRLGVVALGEALDRGEVGLGLEVAVDRRLVDRGIGGEDRHGSPTTMRPSIARTGNVMTDTDGSSTHRPVVRSNDCL